jgi:hypothetical protein
MLDSLIQTVAAAILSAGGTGVILFFVFKHVMKPVDSYLETKAKNLATHEDIMKLVDQVRETEKVKAEITDNVWDRQQRWTAKHALYRELLESLDNLYEAHSDKYLVENTTHEQQLHLEATAALAKRHDAFEKLVKVSAISADPSSYNVLRQIVDSAKSGYEALKEVEHALVDFAASARKDLGYPSL